MPNAYATNFSLNAVAETFSAIWKLTRTMIKAGWRYKASGNGNSSGSWNAVQTGTTSNITTVTGNVATVTGLQGMSPGAEGQWITLTGYSAGGAPNNGTWLVVNYVSSTSVQIYNAAAVGSTSGTNWNMIRDAALDLWGVDGNVNLTTVGGGGSGSGTGVSIAAATAATGQSTITGISGFSQNLSPGRIVNITGSALGNNGNFRISDTTTAGTSVGVYAPQLVAETGNASLTVTEQYGGAGASITTFTTTTSGQSTLMNVTGLSGLTTGVSSPDIGRKIRFLNPTSPSNIGSFTIVSVVSATACTVYGPNMSTSDGNNGSIQWVEWDPGTQTYPVTSVSGGVSALLTSAWHVMQGPTTIKVPIGSNVATGTFIRGENVTQTTTGAQGELLGYMPDSGGGTGYLVIAPRVIGTGGQAGPATDLNMTYGWNNTANTDVVTGATSGATVTTPLSTTPIAYIREMVIWKNTTAGTNGHIWHQCIDQNPLASEAVTTTTTGRFSIMAGAQSQISAQVAPGSSSSTSPATNGFPTTNQSAGSWIGTYVVEGEGGTGSTTSGPAAWPGSVTPTNTSKAQILCANNIEQQLVSADGTWGYYQGDNSLGFEGLSYQRCDNQEDGDLDPYVHQGLWGSSQAMTPVRFQDSATSSSGPDAMHSGGGAFLSFHAFKGFYRRGLNNTGSTKTTEYYSWFSQAYLQDFWNNTPVLNDNIGNPDQVASAQGISTTFVREPVWIVSSASTAQNNGVRTRKGTLRWFMMVQGASVLSTFDSMLWLSLSSTAVMFVVGPYDGVTTPSF